MPAILREVLKTNTFEEQRQIINTIGGDFFAYSSGTGFSTFLKLVDGSASSPALFFDTDVDLGLFKSADGVVSIASAGSNALNVSSTRVQPFVDFIYESQDSGSVNFNLPGGVPAVGSGYAPGQYVDQATTGGTGNGLTVDFTVLAFEGSITNAGAGYTPGTYNGESLTNVSSSGSNGTANIVVGGLATSTLTAGSGYDAEQTFSNIPLQGSSTGSGATATLIVDAGGTISSFTITSEGNANYTVGDILTVNNSDLVWTDVETGTQYTSGGSGFQLEVVSLYKTVTSFTPPTTWSGTGYAANDTVSAALSGGDGNFVFTFSSVGAIDQATGLLLNQSGTGYTDGDIISPDLSATTDAEFVVSLAGDPVTRASISTLGDAIFNSVNVTTDFDVSGNATIDGTATIGNLNLQGSLTGATLSGESISVTGSISSNGGITVQGGGTINGDISLASSLFQIDDLNNKVSINGPTDNTVEDYMFEVNGTSKIYNNFYAAVDADSAVSIGLDDGPDEPIPEKLTVTGNVQASGDFYAGDGASLEPAFSFTTDKTLGLYKKDLNEIGLSAYNGDIATFSSSAIDFYKPLTLINEQIDDFTLVTGRGFAYGLYTNVVLDGGTGADFTVNLTVGFSGTISSGGSGYTDANYTGVPLEYASLVPGAISNFGTITGGSNYSDGTYTDVALTNVSSSGSSATANITVTGGSVTAVNVQARGSAYAVNDVLSAATADIGGPLLVSGSQLLINNGGSGYENGTYNGVSLTNVSSSGSSATADITVSGGAVTNVEIDASGSGYSVGDTLSVSGSDLYTVSSFTLTATNNNADHFSISGTDAVTTHSSADDPTINVNLGDTLTISVNATGHPLYIVTQIDAETGGYDAAFEVASVTGQGATNGDVVFDTSLATAGTYYYVCGNHSAMQGQIIVANATFGSGAEFEIESSDTLTGSGFQVTVADIGGAGSGSGAVANITIGGGVVTKVEVTDPGNGLYDRNEVLTVDYTNLIYFDDQGNQQTSVQPTSDLEFTITDLSGVSFLEITDYGAGYSVGDVLTLPSSFTDLSTRSGYSAFSSGSTVTAGNYVYTTGGDYVYRVSISGSLGSSAPVFGEDAVGSVNITNAGSGYPASETYTELDVISVTGTGTGLKVDVTTNASGQIATITPQNDLSGFGYNQGDSLRIDDALLNSKILNVSITEQSGDYEPDGFYTNIPQTSTSGNGIGALFNCSIDSGGNITSVVIVDGGTGYAAGDTITIAGDEFGEYTNEDGDTFSSGPATFTVSSLTTGSGNAFTVATTDSSQVSGTATLVWYDYQPSAFSLTVDTLETFNNIQFNSVNGELIAKKLTVDPDGIAVGTTLTINNNTIATSSGNLTLSSDANSQTIVSGTGALALPSGDDLQRPTTSLTGSIRFNTVRNQFEGLVQGYYVSLGGVRDVDGNTFISAELNPGDDDNTIRFYNDGVLSQFVEQNKLTYRSISTIQNDDLTGVDEWIAGADATLATLPDVNYIYYGDNVYSVDSTGTLDASTPPVHTTGTVTNGTVDLTYVRKVFGNLELKSKNINFVLTDNLQINSTDLVLNPDGSDFKIQSGLSDLSFGFNPTSQNSNQVYKITSDGSLSFNKGYGSASDNYQKVLDYELKEFELLDTKLISNTGQLDSSVTTSVGITLSSWDTAISGKIFVEIEEQYASPVTNPQRQYSEISYLIAEDAQDILYTETNKLYNNALLGDVTLSLDTSSPKNIIINFAHSTASNTALYNIKVVSQLIRR